MTVMQVSLNDSALHLPIIQPHTGSLAFIWQENEWIQEAKLARNYSTKESGRDSASCQFKSLNWITVRSNHHQCWHRGSYLSRQVGSEGRVPDLPQPSLCWLCPAAPRHGRTGHPSAARSPC